MKLDCKRPLAVLLAAAMTFTMSGMPVFAVGAGAATAHTGLCEHHTEHTETCGCTEGTPCAYVCEICNRQDSELVSGVSGDDPAECICETRCRADAANPDCPVCAAEGAGLSACLGKETAARPDGYSMAEGVPALELMEKRSEVMLMADGDTLNIAELPLSDKSVIGGRLQESYFGVIRIDSGNLSDYEGKTLTGSAVSTGQADCGRGLFIDGVTWNLTIENLTIDRSAGYGIMDSDYSYCSVITLVNGAKLNLTLKGENVLKGYYTGGAGICVNGGTTLTITGESDGSLLAVGGGGGGSAAGIGACGPGYFLNGQMQGVRTMGTIRIEGGTVIAQGGHHSYEGLSAAGIGGSFDGNTGVIEIIEGDVTAIGGNGSAGIGGGLSGSVGSIAISGGKVTATAGGRGAAIGSGQNTYTDSTTIPCGSISITGGKVTANGNIGYAGDAGKYSGGSVTISGGSVEVNGDINADTQNVDQSHILHRYSLKLLIYADGLTASGEAVTGTVTIGTGEDQYKDEQASFTVENGKATAQIEAAMLLHGEQPITVTLNGQTYGDKTVDLDTQNEAIWGSQPQLQVKDSSGVTYTYDNGFLTFSETGSAEVTMAEGVTTTDHQIQIAENANVTLTLRDVAINAGDKNRPAILVSNGGNLTLVLTGSSTMEASVRHGAVLAASEAALTIQGTGSLTVKNSAQSADRFSYNVGIWAKTLAIEGNPTLTAEINSDGIGLRGTTIGIHGGRIEAKSGNYGAAGIGGAYNAPSTVTITGGTVYAEGGRLYSEGGALSNPYTQAVITGGSVNMNRLHNSSRNDFKQPKNTSDALLYCATLAIGSGSTLSKNAQVLGLTIKRGGSNYTYGMDNMLTDGNGKLYLWLPEGAVVSEVKTVNGTYSGSCTTNINRTSNDSGNIWGTASAAFTISGAMFYPVEGITLEEISKTGKFRATPHKKCQERQDVI